MRIKVPFIAGTILSLAAGGILTYLNQSQESPPVLSWDHPLASYAALADVPLGNGLELYTMISGIFFLCFLVMGRERRRR